MPTGSLGSSRRNPRDRRTVSIRRRSSTPSASTRPRSACSRATRSSCRRWMPSGSTAPGAQRGERPNPQSGPIWVEGAEPGDALEVTIVRLTPSRETGWTRYPLAPNVVDPDRAARLPDRETADWAIDVAAGTVRLVDPAARAGESGVASRPDDRLLWRRSRGWRGHLHLDPRTPRRQHGLARLPAGNDRLVPGERARRAPLCR